MESYLTTCHSHICPSSPASISSTGTTKDISTADIEMPSFPLKQEKSSPPTNHSKKRSRLISTEHCEEESQTSTQCNPGKNSSMISMARTKTLQTIEKFNNKLKQLNKRLTGPLTQTHSNRSPKKIRLSTSNS